MSERLLSVGLDVGTTSTQMIFSRLGIENKAGSFSVPEMAIASRQVLYKSDIHFTPLLSGDLVDAAWHLNARRDLDWADADAAAMADVADVELPYIIRTDAAQADVEAAFGPVKALAANGYLLSKPMTRKAIEAAGLNLLAVRPVFN